MSEYSKYIMHLLVYIDLQYSVILSGADSPGVDANGNAFDFTTKLLHLAWHPSENSIACAAANSLYMYYA